MCAAAAQRLDAKLHFPGLDFYLLEGECVVGVEEAEAVPAGFQLCEPVLAVPVFVAAETRCQIQKVIDSFGLIERLLND